MNLYNDAELLNFNIIDENLLDQEITKYIIKAQETILKVSNLESYAWQDILAPIYQSFYQLNQICETLNHLLAVNSQEWMRKLQQKHLDTITSLYVEFGQNKIIYAKLELLKQYDYDQLNPEQQKILINELRDFQLNGTNLTSEQQQQFKKLQQELSELSHKFEQNVMDSTDEYALYVDPKQIEGVPVDIQQNYFAYQSFDPQLSLAKITLHQSSYLPIMQYANDRNLREKLYHAYTTRCSEFANPQFNNSALIKKIIIKRQQLAQLLKFENYATLSLYTKMANTTTEVIDFLFDLATKSKNKALEELAELKSFAATYYFIRDLEAWDISYYSEKLLAHNYNYTNHELKQYFQQDIVLQGLFKLINALYQIEFKQLFDVSTWHPEVIVFALQKNGNNIAYLYLDFYARAAKQSGAWMHSAEDRHLEGDNLNLPVAYIITNFTKSNNTFNFEEVETLFHEMGHALHHLLTEINHYNIAGINGVEWDAVELPSQFMEYFVWNYQILQYISLNITTKQQLPKELYQKLFAAKHFQSGMQTLRQIEFALFDIILHSEFNEAQESYMDLLTRIRDQIAIIQPPSYNRFPNSFTHIFAGGYGAGYYSYKWAELLACDVFSIFENQDVSAYTQFGKKLLDKIISQGGLNSMQQNFIDLMGRGPKIDALLKHLGIAESSC